MFSSIALHVLALSLLVASAPQASVVVMGKTHGHRAHKEKKAHHSSPKTPEPNPDVNANTTNNNTNNQTHNNKSSNSNNSNTDDSEDSGSSLEHTFKMMSTVYRLQLLILAGVLVLLCVCIGVRYIRLRNYRKMAAGGDGHSGVDMDDDAADTVRRSNAEEQGSTPSAALTDTQFQNNM